MARAKPFMRIRLYILLFCCLAPLWLAGQTSFWGKPKSSFDGVLASEHFFLGVSSGLARKNGDVSSHPTLIDLNHSLDVGFIGANVVLTTAQFRGWGGLSKRQRRNKILCAIGYNILFVAGRQTAFSITKLAN